MGNTILMKRGHISPVNVPTGFTWASPPILIKRFADGLVTDFDITTVKPAITVTYYVDPIGGSDANLGTSIGAPLLNLATALLKVDVDSIRIINLTGDYIARTTKSWNNSQPLRSLSVINTTPYRYISCQTASSNAPTYTVNGTFSNVYQCPITSANSSSVVDLKPSNMLTIDARCPRAFHTLTKVADLATVSATPGSWFNDGTVSYIRAIDDRNLVGDTFMQPCANANNGRFPSINNCTIYVEGIDFVGGSRPWYSFMLSAVTGTIAAFNNCSFQGSGLANGLNVASFQSVYLYRCGAYNNWNDGFNYHSNESDGTTAGTSPSFIEIDCAAIGNGTWGSAGVSDNASTSHDFCKGIRLNGNYINSHDRVLVDANSAQTWNLGCYIGQALTVLPENVAALDSSKMWLDTCITKGGVNKQWVAAQASTLTHYNSGAVVNNITGEATGTVKAYYG